MDRLGRRWNPSEMSILPELWPEPPRPEKGVVFPPLASSQWVGMYVPIPLLDLQGDVTATILGALGIPGEAPGTLDKLKGILLNWSLSRWLFRLFLPNAPLLILITVLLDPRLTNDLVFICHTAWWALGLKPITSITPERTSC